MKKVWLLFAVALLLYACREDELVVPSQYEIVKDLQDKTYRGLYLLNEGNMGSNKASLDYLDFERGYYVRNLYSERNPHQIKELGDVGNDCLIYGSKLYLVINCSNKLEILDAKSGVSLGKVDIPNCRYLVAHKGSIYVSAYVAPVSLNNPNAEKGAVYRIDTLDYKITERCEVGYQPEEMAVYGDILYVANSGGYMAPNYDDTFSVISLQDNTHMTHEDQVHVAINLHHLKFDKYGQMWLTSRGDYEDTPSNIFCITKANGSFDYDQIKPLNIPVTNFDIVGDSLYYYSVAWSNYTLENTISYGIINIKTKKKVTDNFITDGTQSTITIPYGIKVHPVTKDIYVTDAKNYVSSGTLRCYSKEGKLKWEVRTGDIPGHMCFFK